MNLIKRKHLILATLVSVTLFSLQCVGGVNFQSGAKDEDQQSSGGHANHGGPLGGSSEKTDFTPEQIASFFDPVYLSENETTSDIMWCVKGNGVKCTNAELMDDNNLKKVLIFPAGYTAEQYVEFKTDFNKMVLNMSDPAKNQPNVYTAVHAEKMLYIAYWIPGGAMETPTVNFKAKVAVHPINGEALSSNTDQVVAQVESILANELSGVKLFAATVFFNVDRGGDWTKKGESITAYAVPPNLLGKHYGIANFTKANVIAQTDTPAHELAHAGLNFLDEYVSKSMADMNISKIDVITPLIIMNDDGSDLKDAVLNLIGTYSMKVSEIIAHNGNDNLATTRYPTTVTTDGFEKQEYEMEGGMFFGRGTWHDTGDNLMNDDTVKRGEGDDFAYDHSPSQLKIINQSFNKAGYRPNDRLRNAGPVGFFGGWDGHDGETMVLFFDADKAHHYHPTVSYDIEVGWYDRVWESCGWLDPIGLCYREEWTATILEDIASVKEESSLGTTALFGLANFVQKIICKLGIKEAGGVELCVGDAEDLFQVVVPGIKLPLPYMPYQKVGVPTPQWLTTYYWRFRTKNSQNIESGWTSWASFYRKL